MPNYFTREMDEMIAVVITVDRIDPSTITFGLFNDGYEVQVCFSANDEKYAVRWRCSGVVHSISTDLSSENLVAKLIKQKRGPWTAPALIGSTAEEEILGRPLETSVGSSSTSSWLSKLGDTQARDGIFYLD